MQKARLEQQRAAEVASRAAVKAVKPSAEGAGPSSAGAGPSSGGGKAGGALGVLGIDIPKEALPGYEPPKDHEIGLKDFDAELQGP